MRPLRALSITRLERVRNSRGVNTVPCQPLTSGTTKCISRCIQCQSTEWLVMSVAVGSAPAVRRTATASARSFLTASINGVWPTLSGKSGFAPCSSKSLTTCVDPSVDARPSGVLPNRSLTLTSMSDFRHSATLAPSTDSMARKSSTDYSSRTVGGTLFMALTSSGPAAMEPLCLSHQEVYQRLFVLTPSLGRDLESKRMLRLVRIKPAGRRGPLIALRLSTDHDGPVR